MSITVKEKSPLKMNEIFFRNYSFSVDKPKDKIDLVVSNMVEYLVKPNIDNEIKVIIYTDINSKDEAFKLHLETEATFEFLKDKDINTEMMNEILHKSTIAIMFSFIRSQIHLLTSQPGMQPVFLPPIDINKIKEKAE
ncbi:MAG: protein-export chaperone SecB [Candidatus Nanoarchaeia archaeon]|nr:protein-export chaperone SecB [Candidatus Nanoarchaeia archaeon]